MLLTCGWIRTVAVAGALATGLALPTGADAAAAVPSSRQVFVTSGAGVVGLSISSGRLRVPVELAEEVSGFGVSPDARTLWMVTYGGSNVPLDIASGSLGADLGTVGCADPTFSPDGRYSWQIEACSFDDSRPVVDRQDLQTGNVLRLSLGPDDVHADDPRSVLLSPDGRTAYVTVVHSGGGSAVRLLDAVTGALGRSFPVPQATGRLITPDGATMVLIGATRVTVVDLAHGTVRGSVPLAVVGQGWSLTPDGTTAWLASGTSLVPLDLRTSRLGRAIPLGGTPDGVAMTPGGTRAYVGVHRATGPSGLVAVDLVARTVSSVLVADGFRPVVMPSQAPRAAFAVTCRGGATRFDGSTSRAVDGRVARYDWTFGDGSRATSSTPVVTHTYAGSARRTVSLTVTDLSGTSTQRVFDGSQMLRNGGPAARAARSITVC